MRQVVIARGKAGDLELLKRRRLVIRVAPPDGEPTLAFARPAAVVAFNA
jgi:hypothetical protein